MEKVNKNDGFTASEKKLAELADKSFLDLWSYPNLFIDKKTGGKGAGKELTDLLVVCGNDVIIFSDKSIAWNSATDINIIWRRWFDRAVTASASQVAGAIRWIEKFPNRIFTDKTCTQQLPVEFPPHDARRFHGVVIATGASEASKNFHRDDSGTFFINPCLIGRNHTDKEHELYVPFSIGDIDPNRAFIHVFDDFSIKLLLQELDTITDFIRYLEIREECIRNKFTSTIAGEEDLLGYYMLSTRGVGGNAFFDSAKKISRKGYKLAIAGGMYDGYINDELYAVIQEAREKSRFWDELIKLFSKDVLAGSVPSIAGEKPDFNLAERGLRLMALEPRMYRSTLAQSLHDLIELSDRVGEERCTRIVKPNDRGASRDTAYVFMVLSYPDDGEIAGGYEQFRKARVSWLETYCLGVLKRNRFLNYAVGIGLDSRRTRLMRDGGSEEMIAIQQPSWTSELINELSEKEQAYGMFAERRPKIRAVSPMGIFNIISNSISNSAKKRAGKAARRRLFGKR